MKLTEQITQLTNEKIQLQESEKALKEEINAKEALVTQEKQLREAQEEENKKLQEEVKNALVDKLTSLRESAGKPKMEKLNERSIESLRDSISDLEAELKESQTRNTKGSAADPTVSDPEPTPANNADEYNTEDDADDIGLSL
jgi:chromosome segregation ATPase